MLLNKEFLRWSGGLLWGKRAPVIDYEVDSLRHLCSLAFIMWPFQPEVASAKDDEKETSLLVLLSQTLFFQFLL